MFPQLERSQKCNGPGHEADVIQGGRRERTFERGGKRSVRKSCYPHLEIIDLSRFEIPSSESWCSLISFPSL